MRTADVIILGGGIIGLSLAWELRKSHLEVLVLEKRATGLEASHAAAGMLAPCGGDLPPALQALAYASARIYSEFVEEIEGASDRKVDLRKNGTILIGGYAASLPDAQPLTQEQLNSLEPALAPQEDTVFLEEHSVDPRAFITACAAALQQSKAHIAEGEECVAVEAEHGVLAVATTKAKYRAKQVVNCCGAWSGKIKALPIPTRPVKGQMLCVLPQNKNLLRHVIRAEQIYIVPRSDGRVLLGSTVEEAGFDKNVDAAVIQQMRHAACELVPQLQDAHIHEAWAGLRPATPDGLPILGATSVPGYFVATGHFRNGILLAPVTAKIMARLLCGKSPGFDLTAFSATRFLR